MILVKCAQIQFLFSVAFGAQMYAYYAPFLKSRRFSYPYQCLFAPSAQKGMGREKICLEWFWDLKFCWSGFLLIQSMAT